MPFITIIVDYHLELQSALTYYRECNFCYVLEVHPVICMAPTTNCILSKHSLHYVLPDGNSHLLK